MFFGVILCQEINAFPQDSFFDHSMAETAEERILLASMETYLSYLDKPLPSGFIKSYGFIYTYRERGANRDLGHDDFSLFAEEEEGVIKKCSVSRFYYNRDDLANWGSGYFDLLQKQNFRIFYSGETVEFLNKGDIFVCFETIEEDSQNDYYEAMISFFRKD
jgi:hypothetical protein